MAARHRPVSPRARQATVSGLLTATGIVGLLFVALAVYTVVNGELRLPFGGGVVFAFGEREAAHGGPMPLPQGTVAVFACPRPLPAHTRITREHLLTADGLHTVPVVEPAIAANGLFRADVDGLQRLLGRVLRRDKPINFAFTEADFLPAGTRAGPSAGIPPGKRGVWIDAGDVHGLADVRAGDLVDLVASQPVDGPTGVDGLALGNVVDPVLKARLESVGTTQAEGGRARAWVVARGALVITPMRRREIAGGAAARPTTVEEVFVAMAPDEVAMFSTALARDVTMLAAPRSGQPEEEPTEIRDLEPVDRATELRRMLTGDDEGKPATFGMVEVIRGGSRETVTVPRAPEERERR